MLKSKASYWMFLGIVVSVLQYVQADIRYEIHRGHIDENTMAQLPQLSKIYWEFPYLYSPHPEHGMSWAQHLSRVDTIWSAAYDGTQLIGAIIALPVRTEYDPMLLSHPEFDHKTSLMLEEAMIAAPYQKRGIGRKLIRMLLEEALVQGYKDVYLLTVVRSANHPLKPESFIDLDVVWTRLGWTSTHLTGVRMWSTRCGIPGNEFIAYIDNMVKYWHKKL